MQWLLALGACMLSCILRVQGMDTFSFSLFNLLGLLKYLAELYIYFKVTGQKSDW